MVPYAVKGDIYNERCRFIIGGRLSFGIVLRQASPEIEMKNYSHIHSRYSLIWMI